MKKNLFLILMIIIPAFLFSQEWINYNSANTTFPSNPYKVIRIDQAGNKWIGTQYKGLYKYDGTNWEMYNTSNSFLPSDLINDMSFDTENNLWICTSNAGLVKFSHDGLWTIYNKNNSALPVNDVTCITFDAYNNKWIGTKEGLVLLDADNSWVVYNTSNTPMTNIQILSVQIENINNQLIKWIGTAHSLYRYNDIENSWIKYNTSNSALTGNSITNIHIDKKRNKWITVYNNNTSSGGGLIKLDSLNVWTVYTRTSSNIPSNTIYSVTSDPNDSAVPVWIGTDSGLAKLSGQQWTTYTVESTSGNLTSNLIYSVAIEGAHKWIGTERMMLRLSGTTWTNFSFLNSGIPGNTINAVISNKTSDTYSRWIGTNLGLTHFDGTNWTVFNMANSPLPSNKISALLMQSDQIWIGTQPFLNIGGGLVKYDIPNQNWTVYTSINSQLPSNSITSIVKDNSENIWIGTQGTGLVKINSQNQWTIFNEANSNISSNNVKSLIIDNNQKLWIATDYGVSVFDITQNQWTVLNSFNSQLPSNNINKISFSTDYKSVWIATDNGLTKKVSNMWKTYNTTNSPLLSNQINDIKEDSTSFIWIATNNGLIKTDEITWKYFNTTNSLIASNSVSNICLEYHDQQIYKILGTNNYGISIYTAGNAILDKGLYLNILQNTYLNKNISIHAFANRIVCDTVYVSINNANVNLTRINAQHWTFDYKTEQSENLSVKFRAVNSTMDSTITKNLSVNILGNNQSKAYSFDQRLSLQSLSKFEQQILIEDNVQQSIYTLQYANPANELFNIEYNDPRDNLLFTITTVSETYSIKPTYLNGTYYFSAHQPLSVKITINDTPAPSISLNNYPNPFNPTTTINFISKSIIPDQKLKVNIYNIKGQIVKTLFNNTIQTTHTTLEWDGKDNNNNIVSSGIYFCKAEYCGQSSVKKMTIMK